MTEVTSDNGLDELLGKPALIKGEDEAQYRRLEAAVTLSMQPQTFFDKITTRELTDKLWDQRRNKDSAAALVETAFVAALTDLLSQSMPTRSALSIGENPSALAKQYFDSKTPAKRRNELSQLHIQYGITEQQIRAKAMEICGNSIQMFKRMEENNDRFIRRMLKEHNCRAIKQTENPPIVPSEEPVS